jgi:hypothetical protein
MSYSQTDIPCPYNLEKQCPVFAELHDVAFNKTKEKDQIISEMQEIILRAKKAIHITNKPIKNYSVAAP